MELVKCFRESAQELLKRRVRSAAGTEAVAAIRVAATRHGRRGGRGGGPIRAVWWYHVPHRGFNTEKAVKLGALLIV